jgi:hypothetical protein
MIPMSAVNAPHSTAALPRASRSCGQRAAAEKRRTVW